MNNGHQSRSPLRLDLVPNDLLTAEELVSLTGYEKPSEQARILDQNKIHYFRVRNGEIRTTWHFVNNPKNLFETHPLIFLIQNLIKGQSYGAGSGLNKTLHPKHDYVPEPNNVELHQQLDRFTR